MANIPIGGSRAQVARLIAEYVTDSLHDVGYSENALNWIYSLLVDGLMADGEDTALAELLQEIDLIHGYDEKAALEQVDPVDDTQASGNDIGKNYIH